MSDFGKTINAEWTLNKQELKEYYKYGLDLPRIKLFVTSVSGVVGFIAFMFTLSSASDYELSIIFSLGLSATIAIIVFIIFKYFLRHSMTKNSAEHEYYQSVLNMHSDMEISCDLIRQNLGLDTFIHSWKNITKIDETASLLLLFKTPNSSIIIPKRAFGDGIKIIETISQIKEFHQASLDK